MARVLAITAEEPSAGAASGVLTAELPGVALDAVHEWRDVITQLFPVNPQAFLVDAMMIDPRGRDLLLSIRREAPWVPVIVLGDLAHIEPESIVALVAEGVNTFVPLASLNEAPGLEGILKAEVGLSGRVAAALRATWRPEVPPAELMAAVEFALQRSTQQLTVKDMAESLGVPQRTHSRTLKRAGDQTANELLRWGRVLWAVHDLEMNPRATGEAIAADLGYTSGSALGNALAATLGVRVTGARAMGLEGP